MSEISKSQSYECQNGFSSTFYQRRNLIILAVYCIIRWPARLFHH